LKLFQCDLLLFKKKWPLFLAHEPPEHSGTYECEGQCSGKIQIQYSIKEQVEVCSHIGDNTIATRVRLSRVGIVALATVLASCSTGSKQTYSWAFSGAAAGAAGGALLSPNDESRGLNALVFGLTGALFGGLVGILTGGNSEKRDSTNPQISTPKQVDGSRELMLPVSTPIPDFVKARIQPVIVEEYMEAASIGEDGTLREPHKVYRIKRPAEFSATPIVGGSQ